MLIRPFSGAGSQAVFINLLQKYGGNNNLVIMAASIIGCTETAFYIIVFYFNAIKIKKIRYALWTSLFANLMGMLTVIYVVPWIFV